MAIQNETNDIMFLGETPFHARIWQLTAEFTDKHMNLTFPTGTYVLCNIYDTAWFYINYQGAWDFDLTNEEEFIWKLPKDKQITYIDWFHSMDAQIPKNWGNAQGVMIDLQEWGFKLGEFIQDFVFSLIKRYVIDAQEDLIK